MHRDVFIVHLERIHTPSLFHILLKKQFPHQSTINFFNFRKFIGIEIKKYQIEISKTLFYDPWNLAQVPPLSLDHFWFVSSPWETNCGKFIDWT